MKTCSRCGLEKDEKEYFKAKKGFQSWCKRCNRERSREREAADPKKHKEKERLRDAARNDTDERKEWRKKHQAENRQRISVAAREYYLKNNDRLNECARKWRSENKEIINEANKRHHAKVPLKRAARKFVSYAIAAKVISRPNACEICSKSCNPEAHHEDYTKPLEVKWICRQCHGFLHRSF